MNILITHAYAKDNKGDAAILSVLLQQLREAFPHSRVKISFFDDVMLHKKFEGAETISSFLYLSYITHKNTFIKILYSLYILLSTLVWAFLYRFFHSNISFIMTKPVRKIAEEYKKADLIVPIGGGYIRAKPFVKDTFNLILLLHPIAISIMLKKPVILYAQSIGPFYNSFQKMITRVVLNHTNLILVREDNTIKTLHDIKVTKGLIKRTVDAGFLFKPSLSYALSDAVPNTILRDKIIVGITVRRWLSKNRQGAYEKAIANFIDKATMYKNMLFIFIPQVSSTLHHDDDREVALRITKNIKNKKQVINLIDNYDHHQVKALYSSLDFIVGTRFHSVIFSLTAYVPALAIEYEYKTSGIMKDLGLADWVIKIEEVNEEILSTAFIKLMKNKAVYKKILHKNLPGYINQAKQNVTYLKEAYEKSNRRENYSFNLI